MMTLTDRTKYRLNGEPIPKDLEVLLANAHELEKRTGIRFVDEENWAPWSDISYLSEAELKNPGIAANIRAINEVCSHIAFVAENEDREYLGYWRGPARRALEDSPLVWLDNEGQFNLCAGTNISEAILAGHHEFQKLRAWMQSLGIIISATSIREMRDTVDEVDPKDMHWNLQERYLQDK